MAHPYGPWRSIAAALRGMPMLRGLALDMRGNHIEGEGARVTDALVPEMYADHFAREPERLMRLTRLILAGEENGPGGAVGTAEGTDIGHKEARALYRSAILSRFVTTFLIDLLNHMAAAAGYEGA